MLNKKTQISFSIFTLTSNILMVKISGGGIVRPCLAKWSLDISSLYTDITAVRQ